ncbi:MAG TPA: hypothetical protein VMV86_03405 [Methanosarcinales archaeon]|nr:hypothetical protein [Methanosarcinales archaeon]
MSTKGKFENGIATTYDSVTSETVLKHAPVVLYDDFIASSLVIPAGGAVESGCLWSKLLVGGGLVAGAAGGNGWVECTLAATSEAESAYLYTNDNLQFSVTQGLIFETKLIISVLPTAVAEVQFGVGCVYGVPDAMAYSVWFTADGSGEIFCEKDDAATDQSVTSGVTVVNTVGHYYKIDMSDVTNIKFYIDGVRVAAATTFGFVATGANALVQPFLGGYKASGAGLGTLAIDYVKLWQKRS